MTFSHYIGYDTASHVAEETKDSHNSTPKAMLGSVLNALILGIILILGMNFCIQDISSLTDSSSGGEAYTKLWQQIVGTNATIFFLVITIVAIECRYYLLSLTCQNSLLSNNCVS